MDKGGDEGYWGRDGNISGVDRYMDDGTFAWSWTLVLSPFLRADGSNEQVVFPKAMYLLNRSDQLSASLSINCCSLYERIDLSAYLWI